MTPARGADPTSPPHLLGVCSRPSELSVSVAKKPFIPKSPRDWSRRPIRPIEPVPARRRRHPRLVDLRCDSDLLGGSATPNAAAVPPLNSFDSNYRPRPLGPPHPRIVRPSRRALGRLVAHPPHMVPRLALDRALGGAGANRAASELTDVVLDNEERVREALENGTKAAAGGWPDKVEGGYEGSASRAGLEQQGSRGRAGPDEPDAEVDNQ